MFKRTSYIITTLVMLAFMLLLTAGLLLFAPSGSATRGGAGYKPAPSVTHPSMSVGGPGG